jgi:hypothetical protein
MAKHKPPLRPANDHLAAFRGAGGDELDRLTDTELDARLEATRLAPRRALKLALLRYYEASSSDRNAAPAHHDLGTDTD